MVTGLNGASGRKRCPNGCRTSSTNSFVVAYFLDTAERPTISQVMSSAKMLVTYPVPADQAVKALFTISRLLGISASFLTKQTSTGIGSSPVRRHGGARRMSKRISAVAEAASRRSHAGQRRRHHHGAGPALNDRSVARPTTEVYARGRVALEHRTGLREHEAYWTVADV